MEIQDRTVKKSRGREGWFTRCGQLCHGHRRDTGEPTMPTEGTAAAAR